MRKALSFVLSLVLLAGVFAGCAQSEPPSGSTSTAPAAGADDNADGADGDTGGDAAPDAGLLVGMIAMEFGTQSFNDDILDGLERAKAELGIQLMTLEVPEVSDTSNGLRTLAGQGADILIVPTSDYRDGMEEVAAEYPDKTFIYLAEMIEDAPENIMSIVYRENEAAFLAGALGAMLSESDSIGAILAVSDAVQYRYQYGFMSGAKAVNPQCEVQVAFTNSYTDVGKGKELAGIMYSKGADYVGTYSGACNLGVFQAAEEAGDGRYCFGAANGQFDQSEDKIVASVVKPIDQAVYTMIQDYLNGELNTGSAMSLGLKERGVTLMFTPNAELLATVPDDIIKAIEDLEEQIVSGALEVPASEDQFNGFSYTYTAA